MTTIITDPKDLDKADPTDSILFVRDGQATPIRSSVQSRTVTLLDLAKARGWGSDIRVSLEPERVTLGSRLAAMVRRLLR